MLATVVGRTCMAFDQRCRCPRPQTLRPGDRLVWGEAGAYPLSWESRSSHGQAAVFWHDGGRMRRVRGRGTISSWRGQWSQASAELLERPGAHPPEVNRRRLPGRFRDSVRASSRERGAGELLPAGLKGTGGCNHHD